MPKYTAVGCTNRSTKNPNLSFREYVMSGCKIVRGKNPFPITSISATSFFQKTVSKEI